MQQILRIMEKEIDLAECPILAEGPRSDEELARDWEYKNGVWRVEDGWIYGKHTGNSGGMLYSKRHYPGDVLLELEGRTIPPCDNDLNFTWHAAGWNDEADDAGVSYIAGLAGWWDNKAGIEHYPECLPRAVTPLFPFEAGRLYFIQAGSIGGHCFIFVDGQLVIEMQDPNPITEYGKVGLGTYASQIAVRNFRVRQIVSRPFIQSYTPAFD
ncbi:MAG TPA: DUF1080 domain-containing protein [Firmicutes bacterium]|nr:DUF1080 domain-containing protein [Bacillota bacterium]